MPWQEESHTLTTQMRQKREAMAVMINDQWAPKSNSQESQLKELMFLQMFFSDNLNSERKGQGKNFTFLS